MLDKRDIEIIAGLIDSRATRTEEKFAEMDKKFTGKLTEMDEKFTRIKNENETIDYIVKITEQHEERITRLEKIRA